MKETLPPILRLISIVFIIIALSRPQSIHSSREIITRGVDIILCIDTSTSMRALDFKPKNRLDAAKEAAKMFVKGRRNDRIGIVVFAGMSFTQCPLTVDHRCVFAFIDKIDIGMTGVDGTAIGDAIITSLNRLKKSKAKSKVVILLTDGRNNAGEIDPVTAAKAAEALGIKIYTIGAGVPGGGIYPIDDPIFGRRYVRLPEELDEATLSEIARLTGGLYFRAGSTEGLKKIFKKIDTMEKTEVKTIEYADYFELYPYFLFPGFLLLSLEIILRNTYLRRLP